MRFVSARALALIQLTPTPEAWQGGAPCGSRCSGRWGGHECPSLQVPGRLGDESRWLAFHAGDPTATPSLCLCLLQLRLSVCLPGSLQCVCSASWWPMRPLTRMDTASRKGGGPRQVNTAKPCLSFPRLFYLSVYGSTEGLNTRGGGVGGGDSGC